MLFFLAPSTPEPTQGVTTQRVTTPGVTTQAATTQGVTTPSVTTRAATTQAATTQAATTQGPDLIPPVVTGCPADITIQAPSGQTSLQVFWDQPTATDDSGVIASSSSNYMPGDVFARGSTAVTYGFSDEAGNQALCSFAVTVTVCKC